MPEEPNIGRELRKLEHEPLLPVEKKLIAWCIGLGLVLLGLLVWLSRTFFPGVHASTQDAAHVFVRVYQVGYLPADPNVAVVLGPAPLPGRFEVLGDGGAVAASGAIRRIDAAPWLVRPRRTPEALAALTADAQSDRTKRETRNEEIFSLRM